MEELILIYIILGFCLGYNLYFALKSSAHYKYEKRVLMSGYTIIVLLVIEALLKTI